MSDCKKSYQALIEYKFKINHICIYNVMTLFFYIYGYYLRHDSF